MGTMGHTHHHHDHHDAAGAAGLRVLWISLTSGTRQLRLNVSVSRWGVKTES